MSFHIIIGSNILSFKIQPLAQLICKEAHVKVQVSQSSLFLLSAVCIAVAIDITTNYRDRSPKVVDIRQDPVSNHYRVFDWKWALNLGQWLAMTITQIFQCLRGLNWKVLLNTYKCFSEDESWHLVCKWPFNTMPQLRHSTYKS